MKRILYFSAGWCGPCKTLSPKIQKLMNEGLNIQKIDVDSNPSLVAEYGVRNIPTLVFEKNGQQVTKQVGIITESQIRETWNQL
jgi:thioredoxin 1